MTNKQPVALIIADLEDFHALGVARAIERMGGVAHVVDNSAFPSAIKLTYSHQSDGSDCDLILQDENCIRLSEVSGVWWRRPQKYKIESTAHPTLKRFAFDECREAFLGSLAACVQNFMNPVGHSRFSTHKLIQISRAQALGLVTPKTLVTNVPEEAREFSKSNPRAIYKTFTGCDFGFFETRRLNERAFNDLDQLKIAPVILQEEVVGKIDIRATVVGEKVYAAELKLEHSRHPVDGRIDRVPIFPHDLPPDVGSKLVRLTKEFGLRYAAIDLRINTEGEYVFFELNPEGQFLWVEIEARLGICDAIARELMFGVGLKVQNENVGCLEKL